MKRVILSFIFTIITVTLYGQTENSNLKMSSEGIESNELLEILRFEGINYFKIKFTGDNEFKNKGYSIRAQEFIDGHLTLDTLIINTKSIGVPRLETINDTILNISVVAKQTFENKLKLMFNFSGFSTAREFELIETEDSYSLRNLAEESGLPIKCDESFYLLAYILPYDLGNGFKSYCEVGKNGTDAENWGMKFGIKHYLLFEMKIE